MVTVSWKTFDHWIERLFWWFQFLSTVHLFDQIGNHSTLSEKISNQWSTLMSNFRVVLNITQYLPTSSSKSSNCYKYQFCRNLPPKHLVLELIEYCSENWKTSWDCVRDRLNNVISFGFYFLNSNTICYGISLVYCCKNLVQKSIQYPKSRQFVFLNQT